LPGSIVARTTLAILALSFGLSLLFAVVVSAHTQAEEEVRLETGLRELLSTVESTAQIACFLGDKALAKEISLGLLSNHTLTAVRITDVDGTLYESARARAASSDSAGFRVISRKIPQPFGMDGPIGEISLYASDAAIRTQARRYSSSAVMVLFLQMALVAAGVALAVFLLVTRPIRRISGELHRLQTDRRTQLHIPRGNTSDEIGRLVMDVNTLIGSLTDSLSTERELRMEQGVQERKMRLIFDKAATGIFMLDAEGVVQSWNPAFVRLLDLGERMSGTRPQRLEEILAGRATGIGGWVQATLSTGEPKEIDLEIKGASPEYDRWVELSLNPISPQAIQGVVNDITGRKHIELSARRLAVHDSLTGLLNRHGISASLADLFLRSSPQRLRQIAVLQIDLDYFKQVNDSFGHEAGDRVLCHVARALEGVVRRSDVVARYGGDEFIVVLVGVESVAKAREIADKMIERIREPVDLGSGRCAHVGASIGIAFPSGIEESGDAVLRRADAAMYEAKQRGRCRACVAPAPGDSELSTSAEERGAA